MPRAGFKLAPGIDVELERPDSIFLPGDIVNGNVVINSITGLAGGQNNVHINFYGRSKVLIVRSNGQTKDYYRGRAILFQQKFFLEGPPVSEASGRESWGLSVQIPTHTVPGEYKYNDTWKKASKYLNNTEMDITQHPLPGVFYYCGEFGGTKGECYVEYVMEVSLRSKREVQDPSDKKRKKDPDVPTTIFPLVVRTRSSEHPINYSHYLQGVPEEVRIKTLKLLPQFATEQLGFKQNLKSVFRPSKIPNYFFDLKITCPSTIQLDNPSHFPFRLSIIPKSGSSGKGSSSSGSILNYGDTSNLPDVKISAFSLCLKMWSMMRARGVLKRDSVTERNHDFAISPDLPPHMVGYVIPREGGTGVSGYRHPDESNDLMSGEQYLDLGQILNLQVSRTHSTRLKGERNDFKTKRPLWPSFKTYNIHCCYEWKYKITIICAGETQVVKGKQKVELIGPSEEQEQNLSLDKQGIKKNYGELMAGAEGAVVILGLVGQVVAEAVNNA
ncbi:uncharacterized protein DFL_003488 [Arthrobotrys flagrans]|uniref:Arrestin-like N-terminal domain-containing protein n=1 Tax=Arthrobotrys flagrans TaxID=97331 RepID=A0A437A219_ARTFL|nr:hypothetical protein DFL_003488 [Arthrobotrys flagrans]